MRVRLSLWAALVALLAIASACRNMAKSPGGAPAAEAPSGEPRRDFARAVELQRAGDHLKSVPFFRAAAQAEPMRSGLHLELGKALHNASIEMGFSGHAVRFELARSEDRARMRREALAEVRRSIELEPDPGARAYSWFLHARMLELAGYVLDAHASVERALELNPSEPTLIAARARLEGRLRGTAPRPSGRAP
jgi:tetratricopeptide (TPR) repeat protein